MMASLKLLAVLMAVLGIKLVSSEVQDSYCYSEDQDPYLLTSTKTPYYFVHGLIKNTSLPNCKPMQVWALFRHGTRYPAKKEIRDMINELPELQREVIKNHEHHGSGSLCKEDIENLKSWKLNRDLSIRKPKYLIKQGKDDLSSLGIRFKYYFPDLLKPKPSDDPDKKHNFKSTSTQRTVASMASFMKGLYGNNYQGFDNNFFVNSEIVSSTNDTLLRAYDSCKSWLQQTKSSDFKEVNDFINGTEFQRLISNVSMRLGFPHNLTFDTVWLMYTMCSYDKAWYVDKLSPWCAVFTKDEMEVFEYEGDLFTYYRTGYGQDMSRMLGCSPVKDMVEHFTTLEEDDTANEPQGIFYFTHNALLQTVYTAMGIAEDSKPLTASNFRTMGDRKWRSSFLVPFAANLAAVLYKCDSSYKVKLYLNEKPLDYEGCQDGLCDWEYLKQKLQPVALNCNLGFCNS